MKKLFFTEHAKDRCLENNINYRHLKDLFKNAKIAWVPDRTKKIDRLFHGGEPRRYKYAWGVLYTYVVHGNTNVVLTITPKKKEEIVFKS